MSTASQNPQKKPAPTPAAKPAQFSVAQTQAPIKAVEPKKNKDSGGFILFLLIALPVFGALIYFFGYLPRQAAGSDLDHEQKLSTQRQVIYAVARVDSPKIELPLPGAIEAFQQASIYARTNGYVKRWLVDLGDPVKEGDLLAELDTPEVDQQLSVAKANSEQARANLAIAQIDADRWGTMVASHAVSQEEADQKNAALAVAKATLDADLATVQQLTDEQNFKEIRAPFSGTISHRDIEVGNLVSSGNGTGTHELYQVVQTDPLRLYVDVPEASAPAIHPGVGADIHIAAYPNRIFHGEVVRSAGALDVASRTLRTEIRVGNEDGALLPGAFAEVRLQLTDPTPIVLIPANTLIVNSAGTQVALVEHDDGRDIVHFLPVKVGRDFGTEVEILQNVKDGDHLVANPDADMSDGTVVIAKPLPPKPAAVPPAGSPPQKS